MDGWDIPVSKALYFLFIVPIFNNSRHIIRFRVCHKIIAIPYRGSMKFNCQLNGVNTGVGSSRPYSSLKGVEDTLG